VTASPAHLAIRPRTTGEILDEAWRLALADAPLLLVLSGLFAVPAAVVLLLLWCQPRPEAAWRGLVLPAAAATLLPLTGLGSGACQEALRQRAEGKGPTLRACLRAAWVHGLDHVAARALILTGGLLGGGCLLLPGLAVWVGGAAVHPVLAAGESRLFDALAAARRESQRQPGKAAAVVLSRLPLLVFAVLNLHTVFAGGLWIAERLVGFDLALPGLLLALDNPAYLAALFLLAWLLLAPHAEAANYLLHVDARARYEGLDLWYRVRRHFPTADRGRGAAVLLACVALLVGEPVRAQKKATPVHKQVRQEIATITQEIREVEPYPGGGRWAPRLQHLATRLEGGASTGSARARWFRRAVEGFAHRGREDALRVLADVDQRLAILEEAAAEKADRPPPTREQLKQLLPPASSDEEADAPPRPRKQVERRPVRRDDAEVEGPGRAQPQGPAAAPAQPGGGFAVLGWLFLAGCFAAVLVAGGVLLWRNRGDFLSEADQPHRGAGPSVESLAARPEQHTVAGLWRQAEELAAAGRHREAVRALYLAVLLLLHRADRLRLEPTRTNGEYARQLRAWDELHRPFTRLTALFEVQWFGNRDGRPDDYAACRRLAENIRDLVKA
jgi:hypothetical protein